MPDRASASPSTPAIILHGRRLHLSETQTRVLSVLLARAGHLVPETELVAVQQGMGRDRRKLWRAVSRLRLVIAPHGFAISRVQYAGYRLVPEEELP